jgi:hypothetical protein
MNKLAGLVEVSGLSLPGDSGGAVLDDRGELIAIAIAINAERRRTYVAPVAPLLALLEQEEPIPY